MATITSALGTTNPTWVAPNLRREVPIYEARPHEYTAWLVEGLIKIGEGWLEVTTEMDAHGEWPFLDNKQKEEGFVHTGLTLGHIQMVVDSDVAKFITSRRIRIMPLGKEFINQQKGVDDVDSK